jgi:hypothetical protein
MSKLNQLKKEERKLLDFFDRLDNIYKIKEIYDKISNYLNIILFLLYD